MNDSLEATSNDYTLRRASSLSTNELNYQRTLASKLSAIKKSSSRIGHAETRKQHERSYESIRKDLLAKRHSGDSGQEAPTKPRSLRVRQNERQSSHSRTPSRRRSKKKSRAMRRRSSAPKMDADMGKLSSTQESQMAEALEKSEREKAAPPFKAGQD